MKKIFTKRDRKFHSKLFFSKMYIYTNKPSKVLFALTKLLMTDKVTRIDGISWRTPQKQFIWKFISPLFLLYVCRLDCHVSYEFIYSHNRQFELHTYSRNTSEMNFQLLLRFFYMKRHTYSRNNGEMNFQWTAYEVLYTLIVFEFLRRESRLNCNSRR